MRSFWFLIAVLFLVNLYSFSTLTTKPAYWYDEAINVELARNFAEFGKLDLVVAPDTFSGKGATVGSTGYPVTVPLAGFFKVFGFGLEQARIYMLLWMSALILVFFFVAWRLWGEHIAYQGTLLIATFAPFYGNGRSVMGEIPGFLFFLLSFYFLEKRKWWQSGILLGLAVISKPSVFVFFIPAYVVVLLLGQDEWQKRIANLMRVGFASLAALAPWILVYSEELTRGGFGEKIFSHFKNPYQEIGLSISTNIINNLQTFFYSTTLLYFTILLALVIVALYLSRELFRTHRNLFILSAAYVPLALLHYLRNIGYLRYLLAAEFLVFILFAVSLPSFLKWALSFFHSPVGENPENDAERRNWISVPPASRFLGAQSLAQTSVIFTGMVLTVMIFVQTVHLLLFSDLYPGEKTQKTIAYLSYAYSEGTIGIINVPQIASLLPADEKYQYLSTYGLWQFGVNPLLLPPEQMPKVIVADADDPAISLFYEKDTAFSEGFLVYKRRINW